MWTPDEFAASWAKENNCKAVPSGAAAANYLGISNQVPAKIVYYTDCETQTAYIDGLPFVFIHHNIDGLQDDIPSLVVLAVEWIGERQITEHMTDKISRVLTIDDIDILRERARCFPVWIRFVVEVIICRVEGDARR